MKTIYRQDNESQYNRQNRYDGLKSLFYFILMVAIFFSMLFMPDKIHAAGNIKFGVQITDNKIFSGTISGQFLTDFNASDLYIMAYPGSEPFSLDKIFSLTVMDSNPQKMVWKNQIAMISTYGSIKSGGWGTIPSIDFSPLMDRETGVIPDLVFVLLLIKQGGDPMNPSDWYESAVTSLLTDPCERVPGQTLFETTQNNNRYYPVDVADGNVEPPPSPTEDYDKDDSTTQVEKPDIYKISGNRIFYANGSAGRFQVVDISNPATPVLVHSESIQNVPLDLYIINDYVILLEQMSGQNDLSVVLKVFHMYGDIIQKVSEQIYTDLYYLSSRRAGDKIFITGTDPSYYNNGVDILNDGKEDKDSVEGGSSVVAIDISTPASPSLISRKNFDGYDSDIYINEDYLVQISRVSWDNTILNLFDLHQSDPLTRIAQIKIPGRIPSEYHVNISDNTMFVIYRDQDIKKGSSLKIFEIHPESGAEKGAVEERGAVDGIAPGEELFAGTFTDNRAYIVTYERKDPLWVVDISDHDAPSVIGELEVPGWSEYIRFHKNRLIALGYDDSNGRQRISVALFSVEDPLKPLLLDRVTPLSGIAEYTSSIAIDDDRGFYLNSSSGVVMVPVSYYTDGNYSGLEIIRIDSNWNSFKREDFVQANFNVKRGSETNDSENIAVSMGDSALNTIDITSDQKPMILGELRLAYNVEKIALYEDGATQEVKSIFAIGGDFYTNGTSDLMRYDTTDGGWNFTKPSDMRDSELLYPELLLDKDGFGVLFSWSSSAFRLFDQKSMKMGAVIQLGDTSTWSTSDPIVAEHRLYFAVSQYSYVEESPTKALDDSYIQNRYSMDTTLKRYDCSDINSPEELPDISIPGTPKALFNGTRLISIETYNNYYYPYYLDNSKAAESGSDSTVDSVDPTMPPYYPDNPDTPGTRINALELGDNSGVLDKTRFFDQESYGYSSVICDEKSIYLVGMKDDQTDLYDIDPESLNIINTYSLKGNFSPVKARNGRIVLTSGGYYPYWRYSYDLISYWNSNEVKVIDISDGILKELTTFSNDIYPSQSNTVMADDGIYIANGYREILYFPFNQ